MNAVYWQRGETLDYLNSGETKIEAGTVVKIGQRIGVAGTDILPGKIGSLHVAGVYEMDKAKADESEIKMGTPVYLVDGGITAEAETAALEEGEPTPNVPAGYAAADASASSTKVMVAING